LFFILQVIAPNFDRAIETNGGVLDSVSHIGVTYYAPKSDGSESHGDGGRLEVDLQVRGHYTTDLNIDFDYIVVSIFDVIACKYLNFRDM
jgi:hypothetical protein